VGLRAGLDDMEKRKFLPHRDSNSDPFVVQSVTSRYTDCAVPALKKTLVAYFKVLQVLYQMGLNDIIRNLSMKSRPPGEKSKSGLLRIQNRRVYHLTETLGK
jgi:hypothetical protein